MVARELLHQSGSVFVQISDENVHHVRELLDEVFGEANFLSLITFVKSGSLGATMLPRRNDYVIWYAKDVSSVTYRQLYQPKALKEETDTYNQIMEPSGSIRRISQEELESGQLEDGQKAFRYVVLTKPGPGRRYDINFKGKTFNAGSRWWGFPPESMQALIAAGRVAVQGNSLASIRYFDDFPCSFLTNLWQDTATGSGMGKLYVVQTAPKVIQRCMLMCTDPGDLVLDPTCGSGTTAYVAEQWGRRWITIDTSRVPLALARQRLLTATFPYYKLKTPQAGPAGGFVYERKQNRKGEEIGGLVPHITLKSIANNEPPAMEVLVDRPEEASSVTRVSGPFVVEASIAPVQPLETAGDDVGVDSDVSTHIQRMTEVLRQSKTLHLPGNRELTLSGVRRTVDTEYLHAEALEGQKRVAIVFGPADGAISTTLVYESGREAHYLMYDRLYFFGFAIDPGARAMIEDEKKLRIPAAYVAVTPDVAMSDLLKTTRSSEIFSITGLPDVTVRRSKKKGPDGQSLFEVELNGLDTFDPASLDTDSIAGERVPCWMLDTRL